MAEGGRHSMLIFSGFLFGTVLFYLFPFFPFFAGILYAYLRFSPAIDSLDVWNRELRVTGSFAPKAGISSGRADMETFTIDTAADEESGKSSTSFMIKR
jgi:hypothetical protein